MTSLDLSNVTWGEFLIGDLFEVYKSKGINKSKLPKGSDYEYITRTSKNNGVHSLTGEIKNIKPNPKNVWSVGLLQMNFFYREKEWYSGQFVRYVKLKKQLSKNQILFLTVVLNKLSKKFKEVLVRNFDKHFLNTKMKLPVTADGDIDYDFMDRYVEQIINKKQNNLKEFLIKEELYQNELTSEEVKAILKMKNNKVQWGEFLIGDLLYKVETNKTYETKTYKNKNSIPATAASHSNNQLTVYVKKQGSTILKNMFSATANGTGKCFYQPFEFTICQDSYAMDLKEKNQSKNIKLFYLTSLNKIYNQYDWNYKSNWNRVREETIKLPVTADGSIDYEFMENYIKGMKKLKVKQIK